MHGQQKVKNKKYTRIVQIYCALERRTALLWALMQDVLVIPYLRFGRNSRSNLQGSRIRLNS